jgi:hypothetical protein
MRQYFGTFVPVKQAKCTWIKEEEEENIRSISAGCRRSRFESTNPSVEYSTWPAAPQVSEYVYFLYQ